MLSETTYHRFLDPTVLFSWMRDVDGITAQVLSKILKHVLSEYQEVHNLLQLFILVVCRHIMLRIYAADSTSVS